MWVVCLIFSLVECVFCRLFRRPRLKVSLAIVLRRVVAILRVGLNVNSALHRVHRCSEDHDVLR